MIGTRREVHIIDHDIGVTESLSLLLKHLNVDIVYHTSAEQFLDQLSQLEPDYLIVEIQLPGISGLELLQRLKRKNIIIPTIFIASYGNMSAVVNNRHVDVVDFLEKPFIARQLLKHIQQMLDTDR